MSTKTSAQESNATYEELAEFNAASDVSVTPVSPAQSSNVFYRIFALLFALAPVAVLYFLKVQVLTFKEGLVVENYKLLDFFIKLFAEDGFAATKLFNFLPMTCQIGSFLGTAHNAALYLIPVSMVVCIIAGIVAIFTRKAAPIITRAILFVEVIVYGAYALSVMLPCFYNKISIGENLDYAILGILAGAFLVFCILSFVKSGKRALIGLLIFLLTVASVGAVYYACCAKDTAIRTFVREKELYKWIVFAVVCVYFLFVALGLMGVAARKLLGVDIVRCVFMLLMGGGVIVASFLVEGLSEFLLYGIISAAIAFVTLVVETIIVSVRASKENEVEQKEQTYENPAEEYEYKYEDEEEEEEELEPEVEEPAPVATEEPAPAPVVAVPVVTAPVAVEEPTPTQAPAPEQEVAPEVVAPVAVAPESDAYGGAFDAFIGMLTAEERLQFTQIFLLRSESKLPEIPEYKIGGDNKAFFRKIFVNLGSLRARIPDGLMEKIYQFSIRQ